MNCKACGAATGHQPCNSCRRLLPSPTLDAIEHGRITERQALDCLKTRTSSVMKLGGGQKGDKQHDHYARVRRG